MQSAPTTQADTTTSPFQKLLVQEFVLEPNLCGEFGVPETLTKLMLRFSKPTAITLHRMIVGPIPMLDVLLTPDVIQEVIELVGSQRNTARFFRAFADTLATARSAQDKYNSCYRSAICHGIIRDYDTAFAALRTSASVNDSWARHHHIYGLIHGIQSRQEEARYELQVAYAHEPYPEPKARIAQALERLNQSAHG